MAEPPIKGLKALLGDSTVFLSCAGKKPILKGWTKLQPSNMTADYWRQFNDTTNIGVLLGAASQELCCIDIDDDEAVEPFLKDNPLLKETFRVDGNRGCKFFVRMKGEYPSKKRKLFLNGKDWGDWLANGSQAVVHGIHPDSEQPYRHNGCKPVCIAFSEIVWPERLNSFNDVMQKPQKNSSASSTSTAPSTPLHVLHNSPITPQEIRRQKRVEKNFSEKEPQLFRFYQRHIEKIHKPQAGRRNEMLVKAIPFLHVAVAKPQALLLVKFFYEENQSIFKDPLNQHMYEAEEMWKIARNSYPDQLSLSEKQLYDELDEKEQTAFRICRDLALKNENRSFFLSCDELAGRLGKYSMEAQRLLRKLEKWGMIKILEKGRRRIAGTQAKATSYQWLLQ